VRDVPVRVAAAAVVLLATVGAAGAQDIDLAVSGFAVAPPPGYVAQPGRSSSRSRYLINLAKPAEPQTGCEVSFEALPGFEQFSQDALNRQTDRPGWEAFYREGLGAFYDIASVDQFAHAVVRGAVVSGVSRPKPAVAGWVANRPTLIFMFYTPKGLSRVACFAQAEMFSARRHEFEAVARGLTLPR
jgi:hypothetical protein